MRILLTNDDGVYADGLQTLRRVLEKEDWADVYVVAPERERSASSHAITLHKPLYVTPVRMEGARCEIWSVNGNPADCTKIGVLALAGGKGRPDLVVSGINRGANLGTDVLYSGTVSAAIEGAILKIPSMAVSLATYDDADYEFAAIVTVEIIKNIRREGFPAGALFNINIPPVGVEHLAGVAITRLGTRYYKDAFHPRQDPRGRTYYWLAGEAVTEDEGPETDVGALEQNMVTITPLHLRLTDLQAIKQLQSWVPALEKGLRGV